MQRQHADCSLEPCKSSFESLQDRNLQANCACHSQTGTGTGWPCIHKLGVYVLRTTWTPGNMCSAMHSWQQHQMPNAGLTGHPAMCMAAFDELSSAPEVVATASDGHPPEDQQPFV